MARDAKKTKGKELYFIKRGPDAHTVLKMVEEEDGTVRKESEYKITKGGCECKAFEFQRTCKHLDMVMQERVEGHPVDLSDARACVRRLLQEFHKVYKYANLPEEPYERDETGKVTCATIKLRQPVQQSAILTKGVWEGCLRENGMKVRLVIE
jgi:hypothetical protein